jgi:hypothetical protein
MRMSNIARGERWEDVYEFTPEEHRNWLIGNLDDWGLKVWGVLGKRTQDLVLMELAPDIDNDLSLTKAVEKRTPKSEPK